MTLMDVITKLGIGKTEITVEQQSSTNEPPKPDNEPPKPDNEPSKPAEQIKDSSTDEQQIKIDALQKEIADLKSANQQLILSTSAKPEPTVEERILDLVGLGGILNGN